MEHIVTGCEDCPYQYDWTACRYPKKISQETIDKSDDDIIDFINGGSPSWCQLNTEPITIIKTTKQ